MPTFVWKDGHWRDKATGEPMDLPERDGLCVPMAVIPDMEPYQSPVTGEWITGRRAYREDLKRHNCVDARDLPSPTGGKLRNKRFAKKRGLEHMLKD